MHAENEYISSQLIVCGIVVGWRPLEFPRIASGERRLVSANIKRCVLYSIGRVSDIAGQRRKTHTVIVCVEGHILYYILVLFKSPQKPRTEDKNAIGELRIPFR